MACIVERRVGPGQRRSRWERDEGEDRARVLVGHEAGRQTPEQDCHNGKDRRIGEGRTASSAKHLLDAALVDHPSALEAVVEPAEEACERTMTFTLERIA